MTSPAQPQGAESRPTGAWPGRAGVAYEAQQQEQSGVMNYNNKNPGDMFLHSGVEFGTHGGQKISSGGGMGSASTGAVGVASSGGVNNNVGLTPPVSPRNNKSSNTGSGIHDVTGNSTTSKSRTSCKFCTRRKKRCDYIEVDNKKQPCTLCRSKGVECVFEQRPARKSHQSGQIVPAQKTGANVGGGPNLQLKRARMCASMATGLVGMEENYFVADFFDRLGFFPMSNERSVQRAIMDLLFQPAHEASENARRRYSDTSSQGSGEKKRLSGEFGNASLNVGTLYEREEAEDAELAFAGPLALRRKYYNTTEASGAFSCMLWCTIALGALTSNMGSRVVNSYVKFAEEAIDGLFSPDVDTAKAYAILSMVYAWLDNARLFGKYLYIAKGLVEKMEANEEETPLELVDMIKEQERVLVLHYTENFDRIRECCDDTPAKPLDMDPFTVCQTGLFHMVRFYSDGVFKAFWRDVLARDPLLTETKIFAEKHLPQCEIIEKIAEKRPDLKNTGGALYIRAVMQFVRLPLKTDPETSLKSSIELTKVIGQIPGMVRFGPVKHYVHCLLMGLARPAVVGQDEGAYEKLRGMYNALDIKGEPVPPPEEMDIAKLCKQPFCRGMAWVHQQKLLRMKAELLAKAQEDAANDAAAGSGTAGVRGDGPRSLNGHRDGIPTYSHSHLPEAGNDVPAYQGTTSAAAVAGNRPYSSAAGGPEASRTDAQQPAPNGGGGYYTPEGGNPRAPFNGISHRAAQQHVPRRYSMKHEGINAHMSQQRQAGGHDDVAGEMGAPTVWHRQHQRLGGTSFPPETFLPSPESRPLPFSFTSSTRSPHFQSQPCHGATPSPSSSSNMNATGADAWQYSGAAAGSVGLGVAGSSAASVIGFSSSTSSSALPMSTMGFEKSVSPGGCSGTSRSSNEAVEAAALEAYSPRQADLPDDVYAEAQRRVNDQDERNANVNSLGELLFNDDDSREVPELYQGESDTDDMSFLCMDHNSAASSSEDENMRSLEASLLY